MFSISGRCVVGLVQALDDVVNVVAARAQVGELHLGRIHGDCVNHRCQPEQRLRLPMQPGQRSLNLSNAAAVTVFVAWRQAGFPGSL
jgi:hypothetical protein